MISLLTDFQYNDDDDDDKTLFNNKDCFIIYLKKNTKIGPSPKSHHVHLHSKFLKQAYLI
jgi:hypothetical protein